MGAWTMQRAGKCSDKGHSVLQEGIVRRFKLKERGFQEKWQPGAS